MNHDKFQMSGKLRGYLLRCPSRSLQAANAKFLVSFTGNTTTPPVVEEEEDV